MWPTCLGTGPCRKGVPVRLLLAYDPPRRLSTRPMVRPLLEDGQEESSYGHRSPAHCPGVATRRWGIDIMGPLLLAPEELRYALVTIDYFSKWVEAEPITTISAVNVVKFF